MDENFLMEMVNLKQGFLPVDLNAGANTGFRIPLKDCKRVAFVVQMGDSTSAAVVANFLQMDAASAGNSKALSISNPYYHKIGSATVFTKVTPGAAASSFDVSTIFAGDEGIVVFEVLAEDLDVEGGFAYVSLSIPDATAAKVGACLAILLGAVHNPPYGQTLPAA